jgi:hypothetical protein
MPLLVVVGETLPHWGELHETTQVTLPEASLLTVAVTDTEPPAITEMESAATDTAIGGGTNELLLLQPERIAAKANPCSRRTKDALRFMTTSEKLDVPGAPWRTLGRESSRR